MNDGSTILLDELEAGPTGGAWADPVQSAQIGRLLNHLQSADGRLRIIRRNSEIVFQVRCPPLSAFDTKIDPANRARIIVGANRAAAGYELDDHITVGAETLAKTTAETIDLTSAAADSYIYYLITTTAGVVATLSSSTTWPLPGAGQQVVVLGKAIWSAADAEVEKFWAMHYGQITLVAGARFGFTLTLSDAVADRVIFGELRADAAYGFYDGIIVGLDRLAKTAAENLTVSSAGENWLGYKITKSGSTITATPWTVAGTAPPAQVDGILYFSLGYVTSTGGVLSNLRQSWTGGDIHIAARIG